jgi:hypothetical protein
MSASPNIDSARSIAQQQQDELLQGAQQRMSAWMNRRQEALETGLDAFKRMSACKTPIEIAVIYGEWLSGSMTRVLADLQDGQAHALKMAEQFQTASRTLFEQPQPAPAEIPEPVVAAEPPAPQQLRQAA